MTLRMRMWGAGVIMIVIFTVVSAAPDCQKNDCSACLKSPTCIWCKKENTSDTRCISTTAEEIDQWRANCKGYVVDPLPYLETIEDKNITDGSETGQDIIQMKPQKVKLSLRVKGSENVTLEYKNFYNYPIDLYYLMDGSSSMSDDKEMLVSRLTEVAAMMNTMTDDFRVGVGFFVDKTTRPYTKTWFEGCDNCEYFAFRNIAPLTDDIKSVGTKVNKTKTAPNLDFPEGGFDGLVQAIVCEDEIRWRKDNAIKIIVFATDAGFHYAGDGKLGGIVTPNDLECHLDSAGFYTHSTRLDYPSVGQVAHLVRENNINLIFYATDTQVPLYNMLAEKIKTATCATINEDSSNLVELLKDHVEDIIRKVELTHNASSAISIQSFSKCSGDEMKKVSACHEIEQDAVITFENQITLERCPENEEDWIQTFIISPEGRQEKLVVELHMECQCECEKLGDTGFIPNADQCNHQGDYKCGVCDCHPQYVGTNCECKENADNPSALKDINCQETNTSSICSGRGKCYCGQCQCDKLEPPKEISGTFCQCTNYLMCDGNNGLTCSGNGDCQCNKCICNEGWTGEFCDCVTSQENCLNPEWKANSESEEYCSGHGQCECNLCHCDDGYFGKWCEDCADCRGKCPEIEPCVQCEMEVEAGMKTPDECDTNCTRFTITLVEELEEMNENDKFCTFTDDNGCRISFLYILEDTEINVRVRRESECPVAVNIYGVVFGVMGGMVLIGIITLIVWRVLASIRDRQEYAKFILDKENAQWSSGNNPLFKQATTTIQNPMYSQ